MLLIVHLQAPFSTSLPVHLIFFFIHIQVQLADRSLLPGDVVKLADPSLSKQKGFISDVDVCASVKVLAAGQTVKNIDCKELLPLQVIMNALYPTIIVKSRHDFYFIS